MMYDGTDFWDKMLGYIEGMTPKEIRELAQRLGVRKIETPYGVLHVLGHDLLANSALVCTEHGRLLITNIGEE